MDFVANCLLSIGASPIMSTCQKELEALIIHADVIYINIGTLNEAWIQQAIHAVKFANKHHKPIVLDPVGCGATTIRTKTAVKLLNYCQIVRGNTVKSSRSIIIKAIQQTVSMPNIPYKTACT